MVRVLDISCASAMPFVVSDHLAQEEAAQVHVHAGVRACVYDAHQKNSQTVAYILAQSAQLTYVLHHQGATTIKRIFNLAQDATLNLFVARVDSLGAHLQMEFVLNGTHAQVNVYGLYVVDGRHKYQLDVLQRHVIGNTSSSVIIKGAVTDHAWATYHGTIVIEPGAQGTQAHQENKNILLSPQARARSIPTIEVQAHDVQCGHASAVGTFDQQQMQYMRSRGLSSATIKKLLLDGFLMQVLEYCSDEELKKIIMKRVASL